MQIQEKQMFKYFSYIKQKKTFNYGNKSYTFDQDIIYDIDKFDLNDKNAIAYIIVRNLSDFEIYKTEDDIPEQKQEEVSINYKEMNEKLILALGKLTETLSKNSTNLLQLQTYQNNYNEQSKVYKEEDEILFIPDIDISQTKIKKPKEIVTKQLSDEIDLD